MLGPPSHMGGLGRLSAASSKMAEAKPELLLGNSVLLPPGSGPQTAYYEQKSSKGGRPRGEGEETAKAAFLRAAAEGEDVAFGCLP